MGTPVAGVRAAVDCPCLPSLRVTGLRSVVRTCQERQPPLIQLRISATRQRTHRPSRMGLGAFPSATNRHQLRFETPTIAAAIAALTISTTQSDSTVGDASLADDLERLPIEYLLPSELPCPPANTQRLLEAGIGLLWPSTGVHGHGGTVSCIHFREFVRCGSETWPNQTNECP